MKIVTLMENTAISPEFRAEHGLSLYIETGNHKILFDAGQSDAYLFNAEKLGIDLSAVDIAVLSHGHYDHGGGLKGFLEVNKTAAVYVSEYTFGEYRNASGKYIGLDPGLQGNSRVIGVGNTLELAPGITLYTCRNAPCRTPVRPFGLQKMENGLLKPDDFLHEQYLLIEEAGKRVLFSGCSHRGIVNIAGWIPCDVLIGGFHFVKLEPESEELGRAAQALLQQKTRYYTGHCTGLAQFEAMKKIMGERLQYLSAGSILEL